VGAGGRQRIYGDLHRAFDLGVNFLDTSASYGNGHNHELIAKALKGCRERIVIHSKSGSPRTPDSAGYRGGGSPEYLTRICEESLKRLGIETLDIFCMSRVDPNVPVEESVGAMGRLVEQGKTRYVGLSEAGAESIRRANKVYPIVSLQMEYSLWSRDAESGNIQGCREHGVSLMAYAPLGRGFLAGMFHDPKEVAADDPRMRYPRFQAGDIEHNFRLLDQIETVAKEKAATPAQIAISWVHGAGQGHHRHSRLQEPQAPRREHQSGGCPIDTRRPRPAGCADAPRHRRGNTFA
jgi:aryl-alcohol dehydrogenase-like predicted oxidoreductase